MALNLEYVGKPRAKRLGNPNWKPGHSGNPNGAPKRYQGPSLAELCKAETAEAVKQLIVMMRFKGPNQLPATLAILDRGWGRPAQHVTTDGADSVHLHLLAALAVQPLEALQPQQQEQQRTPLTIDGSVPTE